MAAEKEFVGVVNKRNKTRVLQYEVGSPTHRQAVAGQGGWSLADPEANAKALKDAEKKSVASADGKTDAKAETPDAGGESEETKEGEEPAQTPAPKAEGKPKNKGGKPAKSKEVKND